MADSESTSSGQIGLDELIALNDEIASLIRAGVPLELGLGAEDSGSSRRVKALSQRMTSRMQEGRSLPEALSAEGAAFPRAYRAVIEGGLRTGRLPETLEALSGFAQSLLEIRRRIALAFLYPSILLLMTYGLFVFFLALMVPMLQETFATFRLSQGKGFEILAVLSKTVVYWGPSIPLVVMIVLGGQRLVQWSRSFSDHETSTSRQISGLQGMRWLPGVKRVLTNYHRANFAEMLALLLAHRVPLHEAVRLAADSTGDVPILQAAEKISSRVARGESLSESLQSISELPPFLKWMMSAGEQQGALVAALRQAADVYRRRALRQSEWFKVVLPVVLVLLIGGGVTLLYALSLFLPLADMLRQLGGETGA